jgi:pilus assembly protein Flp/PilA
MSKLFKKVRKFFAGSEAGASLVEYGLLVALIAAVCIATVTLLGPKVNAAFDSLVTQMP